MRPRNALSKRLRSMRLTCCSSDGVVASRLLRRACRARRRQHLLLPLLTDKSKHPPPRNVPQAADEHIVSHSVGRGQAAFDPWRRGGSGGTGGTTQACSSLFTEPMAWMAGIDGENGSPSRRACAMIRQPFSLRASRRGRLESLVVNAPSHSLCPVVLPFAGGEVEGKLSCPKCATRLGTYCWAGAQCSCGAWVTPAFQVRQASASSRFSRLVPWAGQRAKRARSRRYHAVKLCCDTAVC